MTGYCFVRGRVVRRGASAVASVIDSVAVVCFFDADGVYTLKRVIVVPKRNYSVFAVAEILKKPVS